MLSDGARPIISSGLQIQQAATRRFSHRLTSHLGPPMDGHLSMLNSSPCPRPTGSSHSRAPALLNSAAPLLFTSDINSKATLFLFWNRSGTRNGNYWHSVRELKIFVCQQFYDVQATSCAIQPVAEYNLNAGVLEPSGDIAMTTLDNEGAPISAALTDLSTGTSCSEEFIDASSLAFAETGGAIQFGRFTGFSIPSPEVNRHRPFNAAAQPPLETAVHGLHTVTALLFTGPRHPD